MIQQLFQVLGAIMLCVIFVRMVARGRWVTWPHPVCAECGFNLTGLPETSACCPECGEALTKVRRTGVRRRRFLALGMALVLIVTTCGVIVHELLQPWIFAKLPTPVLLQLQPLLFGKDWIPERRITWELNQRILTGQLSDGQMLQAAQIALSEMIRMPYRIREQEQWIQYVHDQGKLPDAMWKKYAGMSLVDSFHPRPKIARGAAISFDFYAFSPFDIEYCPHVAIDGEPIGGPTTPETIRSRAKYPSWQTMSIDVPPTMLAKLVTGLHNVTVTFDTTTLDSKTGAVLVTSKLNKSYTIDLLAEGEAPVKQVPFASLPPALLARWTARQLLQMRAIDHTTGKPQFVNLHVGLGRFAFRGVNKVDIFPVYQVIARWQGKETPLGVFMSIPPFWIPGNANPSLAAPTVDIILRPDPNTAALSAEIGTIFSDELIYKDVPVQ